MATATTTAAPDAWMIALQKSFNNGKYMMPHFKKMGIKGAADLLAFKPSFRHAPSALEVEELHNELHALNATFAPVSWPSSATKGCRMLRRLILECDTAAKAETSAAYAGVGLSGPAAGAAAGGVKTESDPSALAAIGAKQFDVATTLYPASALDLRMSNRVSYPVVGKLFNAFRNGVPVTFSLQEFVPQAQFTRPKDSEYTMFGQTWVSKESHSKLSEIKTHDDLERALQNRRQGVVWHCRLVR